MPPRPACLFLLPALLAAAPLACDDAAPNAGAPPSSAAASASAAPPAPDPLRFAIEPFGSAVFVIKVSSGVSPKDIKGVAKAFGGELLIDPHDLSRTRGEVTVDLSTIEAHGFGDEALDAQVTDNARNFLEVGGASRGAASAESGASRGAASKEPLRHARFTIRSIESLSDKDALALSGDKRSVTLTAIGDLTVHGIKQEKKVDLAVTLDVAAGTVSRVRVRTAKPIVVGLMAHDIKSRSATGELLEGKALGVAGAAHAGEATVTFELSAKPAARTDPTAK